jgi:hypothetical protein
MIIAIKPALPKTADIAKYIFAAICDGDYLDVDIEIEVEPTLDIEAEMYPTDDNTYVIILRDDTIEHIRTTLAHELTHVHQYVRGDLVEDDHGRMFWKGKYINTSEVPYRELPWEIEAYKLEKHYENI